MKKWQKNSLVVLGVVAVIASAQWISIQMAISYEPPLGEPRECAQYVVRAINIYTGAVHDFANPCFMPPGWVEL